MKPHFACKRALSLQFEACKPIQRLKALQCNHAMELRVVAKPRRTKADFNRTRNLLELKQINEEYNGLCSPIDGKSTFTCKRVNNKIQH